jgi:predicted CopG family antitoxin
MDKTITVKLETWQELTKLKAELNAESIDQMEGVMA